MTSGECFENKWLYMKYIGKYLSAEILLTRDGVSVHCLYIINIMDNTKAFEAQIGVFGTHNFLPPKIITKNAEEIVIGLNKFIIQGSLQCMC
jgi:hypothetical protein